MKRIRQNVFETNSSSTHSICISINPQGLYDTIQLDENNNVVLNGGEFGWEIERYDDALTKANYCAIDQKYNNDRIEMLKEVIKEQTGCNKVILNMSDDWDSPNYSYIDHQSSGTSDEAFGSKEILKEFIFGKNSLLLTDNDNH